MARIEQTLDEEPNLINASDGEIRERLETVEELKRQVKVSTLRLRKDLFTF